MKPTYLASMLTLALVALAGPAAAHGDEDHSTDAKPAPTAAVAGAALAGATTINPTTAPTGMVPAAAPRSTTVPSTGMMEAGYPTGASADAMYYDTNA